MIQDAGPAHEELAVELRDRQAVTIGQMVDGLRRHIGHPDMVSEEIPNALRSPDQITFFRHLLLNRVMKSFSQGIRVSLPSNGHLVSV